MEVSGSNPLSPTRLYHAPRPAFSCPPRPLIPRPQLIPLLIAAILGGFLLFVAPLRAADPTPIACPTGQTVYLEGRTIPREALLIYLKDRAVGGGLADSAGGYWLVGDTELESVTSTMSTWRSNQLS